MKAAIYVRVSTQDQKHDMQLTELRGYVGRMGWEAVEYPEKMSSFKKRVVLDRLMEDARRRQFDVVLVWKLDRFARSLRQLLDNVNLLDGYGIRFICLTQGLDTDKNNPTSRLLLHIIGAVAEFERDLIRERVGSGMREAARQGKHVGRPKPIWDRMRAVQLHEKGFSFRQIAGKLKKPESSVRRAIKELRQNGKKPVLVA
jgi:putative DNA-invertase from lambdoid prophage Rac